jgi:hypothetical protein
MEETIYKIQAPVFSVLFLMVWAACSTLNGSGGSDPKVSEIAIYLNDTTRGAKDKATIYIDGIEWGTIGHDKNQIFKVSNGTHLVSAVTKDSYNGTKLSSSTHVTVNDERAILNLSIDGSGSSSSMSFEAVETLSLPKKSPSFGNNKNVERSLAGAAEQIVKKVPQNSSIAIVYITASDRSIMEFVVGELEVLWVNVGYIIIDRSQLDRIRQEHHFQMSGDVDDHTAVSIGKFIGADIIVTGRIDGEGTLRCLRLRALNTQTAQVVGAASEKI